MEEQLGCKFIRSDPDKKGLDVHKVIKEIFRHIKRLSENTLIEKIWKRLLGLQFKSNNEIKSKAICYYC